MSLIIIAGLMKFLLDSPAHLITATTLLRYEYHIEINFNYFIFSTSIYLPHEF